MKRLLLMNVALFAGMAVNSFGQLKNTHTIVVMNVGGKLTAPSLFLHIPEKGTTLRLVPGPSAVPFRIEFLFANPCDLKTSKLDENPAICVIPPRSEGTYMYLLSPKKGDQIAPSGPTPVIFSRVIPCRGCSRRLHPRVVAFACDKDKKAVAVPSEVFVMAHDPARDAILFSVLGPSGPGFSLKFESTSPCQTSTFDLGSPPCEIKGASATYNYEVKLDACSLPGRGAVKVE